MKLNLFLLSLAALLFGGVQQAKAKEVISLKPSKDVSLRGGNIADRNYNHYAIMANNQTEGSEMVGLLGFDLSTIKNRVDAGYEISKIELRLTNIGNTQNNIVFYGYKDNTWAETDITYNSSKLTENKETTELAKLKAVFGYSSTPYNLGASTTQLETYDITKYQSTLTAESGLFFEYVKTAVANSGVTLCLQAEGGAVTLASKDIAANTWYSPNDIDDYNWNGSSWDKVASPKANRFDMIKKYFGFSSDAVAKDVLSPRLIITLNEPTTETGTVSARSSKDIMLRNGDAFSDNYYKNAVIEFGGLSNSEANTDFTGLMTFNIAAARKYVEAGYQAKNAKLVLYNASATKNKISVYKFRSDWKESKDTKYATLNIAEDVVNSKKVAEENLVNPYGKPLFALGESTTQEKVYSINQLKTIFANDNLDAYITDNAKNGDEIGFLLVSENSTTTHDAVFTKEAVKDNYAGDYYDFTWNEQTCSWVKFGTNTEVKRYDNMKKFFGMTESEFQTAVTPRLVFDLVAPDGGAKYTLSITEAGVATLVLPYNATIPSGVKAYQLTTTTDSKVRADEVTTTIPANTPVLIKETDSDSHNPSYDFTQSGSAAPVFADSPQYGALFGTYKEINASEGNYILQKQGKDVAFFPIGAGKTHLIKPFRAYLHDEEAPGARMLEIIFDDDELTGIKNVESGKQTVEAEYYDLSGRRVAQPQKGLYIVNGKKVVIK